jgi:putative hemolysin
MRHPRQVLITVLLVNTTVNVAIFAVSYIHSGDSGVQSAGSSALNAAIALVVVIVFGEILPKAIALAHAHRLAPLVAPLIAALQFVTTPIAVVLRFLVIEPLVRLVAPTIPEHPAVTTADLSELVELSAKQGVITSHEYEMLQAVVALPEISVRSIMIPRVKLQAVAIDEDRTTIDRIFRETGLTKLPVYRKDLDDLCGLLYARDFHLRGEEPAERLLRPVNYVPEMIDVLQLVRHFRKTRTQLAVVVDEYGGVAGLITVQDVLEEIVGDLDTGNQPGEPEVERIDERSYRIPGSLSIRSWRPLLGITDRFGDVDTFGGVVLASLGRLPRVGDTVHFGNLRVTVDGLDGRRIDHVILHAEPVDQEGSAP